MDFDDVTLVQFFYFILAITATKSTFIDRFISNSVDLRNVIKIPQDKSMYSLIRKYEKN